jgi:hypothetical protein
MGKRLVCDQKPHRLAQKDGTIQILQAESTHLQVNKLASWASAHLRKSCSFQIALVLGFSTTTNPP